MSFIDPASVGGLVAQWIMADPKRRRRAVIALSVIIYPLLLLFLIVCVMYFRQEPLFIPCGLVILAAMWMYWRICKEAFYYLKWREQEQRLRIKRRNRRRRQRQELQE